MVSVFISVVIIGFEYCMFDFIVVAIVFLVFDGLNFSLCCVLDEDYLFYFIKYIRFLLGNYS